MAGESYQFVVLGSGFGGAIMSMVLRRLGKTVLMVEQGKHPRFAIGESSTPFANLLLEQIGERYDLPFLKHFVEWGSWQKHHPEIAVGLKRGFSFFHHRPGERLDLKDRNKQLLVAASPNDRVADTHWYRPEFDEFLVRKAVELGVEYIEQTSLQSTGRRSAGWDLVLRSENGERPVFTDFVIDASGANSTFAEHLSIPKSELKGMPKTSGVWAHFRNVRRLDENEPAFQSAELPYPPDDAAVHHIFPGGWAWVLRFNNGITSAGAAFTRESGLSAHAPQESWGRLLEQFPTLAEQFGTAELASPFFEGKQISFVREKMAGENWAMLPSAAGFVDPLLSTGFALTLLGVERLGAQFESSAWRYADYEKLSVVELEATADLVGALYAKMGSFEEFALLTLLYFAAMSFTETAWRLGKPALASSFLLTNDRAFSEKRARICAAARESELITKDQIEIAIAPYDIAGLSDWSRRNWYPVRSADLQANAFKLGANIVQVEALLRKLGLAITT